MVIRTKKMNYFFFNIMTYQYFIIGDLKIYTDQFITKKDCESNKKLKYFAFIDDIETLKRLRDPMTGDGTCPWDDGLDSYPEIVCAYAAYNGHLEILEWLRDPNTGGGVCPWDELSCLFPVTRNDLKTIKWLRDPNTGGGVCPWNKLVCKYAAEGHHIEILKWLRDPNTGGGICPWDNHAQLFGVIYPY